MTWYFSVIIDHSIQIFWHWRDRDENYTVIRIDKGISDDIRVSLIMILFFHCHLGFFNEAWTTGTVLQLHFAIRIIRRERTRWKWQLVFQLKWTVEDKIICRLLTSACRFFLVKLVSFKIGYIISVEYFWK